MAWPVAKASMSPWEIRVRFCIPSMRGLGGLSDPRSVYISWVSTLSMDSFWQSANWVRCWPRPTEWNGPNWYPG